MVQRVDEFSTAEADHFRGQHIGLIFQSFQLLSPLSVLDNLLLGARYGRKWSGHEARDKAEMLLSQVGLRDRLIPSPRGTLAGGTAARRDLPRAINEPPLLLADEPTASLDKANSAIVLEMLFKLCESHGTTLLAVNHDPAIASHFDRVLDASGWMQMPAKGGSPCLTFVWPLPIYARGPW